MVDKSPISWFGDQSIWDSCWSSFLHRFLILSDVRLYTYDDQDFTSDSLQLLRNVRPKTDKIEFFRCVCSEERIFITYDERNTSVDEYDMTQWTRIRRYENILKSNEGIVSLAISKINSNLLGFTVIDDNEYWHFELRDRSMRLISSIVLDRGESCGRLLSLPNVNMNWLIIHTGSKFLTVINETGQSKATTECAEKIDLATFIPEKNCLVLLTQKSKLKFFDL